LLFFRIHCPFSIQPFASQFYVAGNGDGNPGQLFLPTAQDVVIPTGYLIVETENSAFYPL
jgi:hypothetical protein